MRTPQPLGGIPVIGQQQQQMQQQIQAAIQQLSLGIYSHVATGSIVALDDYADVDQDKLRKMASDSLVAARCYFEGIGVLKKEEGTNQ